MCNYFKNTIYKQKTACLEKNIKQLTGTKFFAAKPRVIFTSSPLLTPEGKRTNLGAIVMIVISV